MPYAPGIADQRGEIWQKALGNVGTSISQGIQQYAANKQMAGQSLAQFEAAAAQNPDMLQFLENENSKAPDAVKSAFQSLKTGGTVPLQKAAMLAQFASSYSQQKQVAQEAKARQLQIDSAQMQFDITKRQQGYLNSVLQGNSAQPGAAPAAAAPAPAGAPLPPSSMAMPGSPSVPGGMAAPTAARQPMAGTPASSDPTTTAPAALSQFVQGYARAVGMFPPPEAIEKFMTAQMGRETPIGVVAGGVTTDADGRATAQSYNWVYRKGDGSTRVAPEAVSVPYGNKPPGTQLDPTSFTPVAAGTSSAAPAAPSNNAPVVMTTERQKAIQETMSHLNLLDQNEEKIAKLNSAVNAYKEANPQGMRTNIVGGTDTGLMLRRAIFGDVSGQLVNQGIAGNLNAIMENLRGESKSLGMRLTGAEWMQLKEAFPKTTDAPEVMASGMQAITRANAFAKLYAQEYAKNLKTMAPGDAATAANEVVRKVMPSPFADAVKAGSTGMPTVTTQAEYNSLKSGTQFLTPSGKVRVKP